MPDTRALGVLQHQLVPPHAVCTVCHHGDVCLGTRLKSASKHRKLLSLAGSNRGSLLFTAHAILPMCCRAACCFKHGMPQAAQ